MQHLDQAAKDEWQAASHEAPRRFSMALRKLHQTNPWPEDALLDQAINTLATELWDLGFGVSEIVAALSKAAAGLPRYTGGREIRG